MEPLYRYTYLALVVLLVGNVYCDEEFEIKPVTNSTSFTTYSHGVALGIIDTEKYSFESFLNDERKIFQDLYRDYSVNITNAITYQDWLIWNNFGLLLDTQESLYSKKIIKRSAADNKQRFCKVVRAGDILVTGRGFGGLVGHAAIMTTDHYVLEMSGGPGWNSEEGIADNNQQILKGTWFDMHADDWTTVYRCPDSGAAYDAAAWADSNYYNPIRGLTKTIHVTYHIDTHIWSKNPSYCSKLVIQAYYFGTGRRQVIGGMSLARVIVPTMIPAYFRGSYKLENLGKF